MADLKSKTLLCVDSGNFFSFAQRMAREDGFGRVLYWSDVNPPLPRLHEMSVGDGFDDVQRIESPFDVLDQVDCFAFPDCTQPWMQRWLRNHKKPVWGSGQGVFLEWMRFQFRSILKSIGLPVRNYEVVSGLKKLRDFIRDKTGMVVRISQWRGNMETFLWYDEKLSSGELDRIAVELGPLQEDVAFLVEEAYDATEVGYDGIFTGGKNGQFPEQSFHGIEQKDKSYFGALVARADLPHPIAAVLEKFEPILRDFDYSNNFHAEIRVVDDERFYFTDPTCFSDDTEILTESGWKLFQNLNPCDSVCTLEPSTGQIEYHIPTSYISYWFNGDLVEITNRKKELELWVTPNHSVWGRTKPHKPLAEFRAENLPNHLSIPRTGIWNGLESSEFVLPAYSNSWSSGMNGQMEKVISRNSIPIPMDLWLRFLGIFLSEGHTRKWQVEITQTKYRKAFWEILSLLPFNWQQHPKGFRTSNVQLANYLSGTGLRHERRIPSFIKSLSRRQINLFLDSYCLGDGSFYRGNRVISTTSKRTSDDLQELFLKAGSYASIKTVGILGSPVGINPKYSRNHTSYLVSERSKWGTFYLENGKRRNLYVKSVPYSGWVHDVEVKNHIIFVRRNGKACWSGNCRHASPAGEPLQEAIANFPQVVWEGAHERFLEPDWQYKYAAQVLIEHKDDGRNRWRTIRVPNEIERWVKLCDVCKTGEELYSFPPLPHSNNKVGSVLGMGQTPEEAVEQLKSHVEALGKQDITIDLSKLAEAISEGIEGQGEATEIADESGAESAKSLAQV